MARTINEIKEAIKADANRQIPGLSSSKTAEWNLWAYIMAVAIHTFELILDLFRKEMDVLTNQITPGTLRWYAEMSRRFQNGDNLVFDTETARLYYLVDHPEKKIVAVVAVTESIDDTNHLFIKVAKKDKNGKIVALDADEVLNFTNYIDAIKFAGCQTEIISTNADRIFYNITVYNNPSIAGEIVKKSVLQALDAFKTSIDFDGVMYRQKMIDVIMGVEGVVTCVVNGLQQQSYLDDENTRHPVDTHATLEAGYFEYAEDCQIEVKSINSLLNPSSTPSE